MKESLEQTRVIRRRYPKIVIGSKVRLYYKKDILDKERIPHLADNIYTVVALKTDMKQTFYTRSTTGVNNYSCSRYSN